MFPVFPFAVILNSRVRQTRSVHVPGGGGSTGGTPGVTYLRIPSGEGSAPDPSPPRRGRAGCRSVSRDRRPEKRTLKPGGEDGRVALQIPRKGLEASAIRLYVLEHLLTS